MKYNDDQHLDLYSNIPMIGWIINHMFNCIGFIDCSALSMILTVFFDSLEIMNF